MLCRIPAQRATITEIKTHPYFAGITWDDLDGWATQSKSRYNTKDTFLSVLADRVELPTFTKPYNTDDEQIDTPPTTLWVNDEIMTFMIEDAVELRRKDPLWSRQGSR